MMFRTVFSRMLATNIVISVLTMTLLALVLSFSLRGVFINKQFEEMRRNEDNIISIIEKNQGIKWAEPSTLIQLQAVASSNHFVIWLLDNHGNILSIAGDGSDSDQFEQNTLGDNLKAVLIKVLSGEEIATTGIFDAPLNAPVMTVGHPITQNGMMGAVFIHLKLQEFESILGNVIMNITLSALLAIALSVILTYFNSLRISRPLSQMSAAAKEIARGNMQKRVNGAGKDEIGELASSFNKMVDELQTQENVRRGFIANVSHELRSPLTSIQGFVQGILDGTVPENQRDKHLKTVLGETKRLGKLINDLLDLSQIEAGKFPLHITKFDLNEVARRILITFEGKIEAKGMEVDARFAGGKLFIRADMDRMVQVLANLLDNAVKFSRSGGKLYVRTKTVGNAARIIIADNGLGIPKKDLPFIWQGFYRVDDTTRENGGGTGLGLSIAKKIIEQQKGNIRVRSAEGAYTVFIIDILKETVSK
ncbi:MAG: HAMP domain-containing sensor histidine kinase [Bacillota bacterium]|nr:HAMP domain-containing sensor histidine kinase [Bacillota bacterium]